MKFFCNEEYRNMERTEVLKLFGFGEDVEIVYDESIFKEELVVELSPDARYGYANKNGLSRDYIKTDDHLQEVTSFRMCILLIGDIYDNKIIYKITPEHSIQLVDPHIKGFTMYEALRKLREDIYQYNSSQIFEESEELMVPKFITNIDQDTVYIPHPAKYIDNGLKRQIKICLSDTVTLMIDQYVTSINIEYDDVKQTSLEIKAIREVSSDKNATLYVTITNKDGDRLTSYSGKNALSFDSYLLWLSTHSSDGKIIETDSRMKNCLCFDLSNGKSNTWVYSNTAKKYKSDRGYIRDWLNIPVKTGKLGEMVDVIEKGE